ncbi:MAG: hypothetical protein NVS3B14_13160 [Ktedonobacteraceae bacterium]
MKSGGVTDTGLFNAEGFVMTVTSFVPTLGLRPQLPQKYACAGSSAPQYSQYCMMFPRQKAVYVSM